MKTEKFPLLIYRDEKFETETRAGIRATFDALVKLIDIWDSLDVGPCSNLWWLCTNAGQFYSDTYQSRVEIPKEIGRYQIKPDVFLSLVSVPTPNSLYLAAKAVVKSPAFGYQQIWSIQDGKIFQDEAETEKIIHSRNIYANNESQKALGLAVIEFVNINCFVNSFFKIIPWTHAPGLPWQLTGRAYPHVADLVLEPEQLRVIISPLSGDVSPEIKTFLPAGFDLEGLLKKL